MYECPQCHTFFDLPKEYDEKLIRITKEKEIAKFRLYCPGCFNSICIGAELDELDGQSAFNMFTREHDESLSYDDNDVDGEVIDLKDCAPQIAMSVIYQINLNWVENGQYFKDKFGPFDSKKQRIQFVKDLRTLLENLQNSKGNTQALQDIILQFCKSYGRQISSPSFRNLRQILINNCWKV